MAPELKIRVFFSKTCKRCAIYIPELQKSNFNPILIDIEDEKNNDLVDRFSVEETPYTQIIDSNKIIASFHGVLSPEFLRSQLKSALGHTSSKVKLSYGQK